MAGADTYKWGGGGGREKVKCNLRRTTFLSTAHLVVQNDIPDLRQFFLGEDKANVPSDVRNEPLELCVLLDVAAKGLADGGVLPHQDLRLSSERDADVLHLLRADIVDIHQETAGVFVKQRLWYVVRDKREIMLLGAREL